MNDHIRNIAIVAHVDHGKTTLIDGMLKQAGMIASHRDIEERAMDTHDLEQERGITILAKCTAIDWGEHRINIIDTPGHADFGGEVERVLKMVDTVLLLVDAFEGPMPQTKYVLKKSLELGHRPLVAINKVDRSDARPYDVLDEVFELFLSLNADDRQLDFPVVYTSATERWAVNEVAEGSAPAEQTEQGGDLSSLFEMIIEHTPRPEGSPEGTLSMQIATLDYDDYVGRVAIGRIFEGTIERGQKVAISRRDGSIDELRVRKLFGFEGLERVERDRVEAGELCAVAGMERILPGETITDPENPKSRPMIEIDEPTISMIFMVNDSPFSGKTGQFLTSRQIEERLERELEHNVALRVEDAERAEAFKVSGRGELHLAVLIEEMRREGYELQVSRPEVILKESEDGETLEPVEEVIIELDADYAGRVIQALKERRGELMHMENNEDGSQRLEFQVPSRGLIGYRSKFLTDTRGTGVMHTHFDGYLPYRGEYEENRGGAMIAMDEGVTTAYALDNLQERGRLFVGPGEEVYGGQIIGVCSRSHPLVVNPCKGKKLDNMRAAGSDDAIDLEPPEDMSLEKAIEFIAPDERVEVTPGAIRIRKADLEQAVKQ